ncbi:hypothetical protein [Membranihabitans marinus]|uniref:hypothetical protein n=1 Tax=Membranihabitans marinus TaxID=1227546 RepID=UPI001F40FE6F|nr:hypothetical protein [Membranihabitans marinus]
MNRLNNLNGGEIMMIPDLSHFLPSISYVPRWRGDRMQLLYRATRWTKCPSDEDD